jgi:nicotinate-nucleotide pyrophosphorylase (carboxylating)
VDTRKTTPGMRALEKAAVRHGGGFNHRYALFDGILIKDNHIAAAGSISNAVIQAKRQAPHTMKIEVEVENLAGLAEAIQAGADVVLLDNMDTDMLAASVKAAEGRVLLEASGGVNLETVAAIAATGVDLISVGALTHSATAVDLSLKFL